MLDTNLNLINIKYKFILSGQKQLIPTSFYIILFSHWMQILLSKHYKQYSIKH